MKRFLCAALFAAACSSTPPPASPAQFAGPSGLAVTSAGDRDLLFVANAGSDALRVLQLCTGAVTCSSKDSFQFLPAPVRLFPASIEVSERPIRLAGLRLCSPSAAPGVCATAGGLPSPVGGVVVVAGNEPRLRMVDAGQLLRAAQRTLPAAPGALEIDLDPDAGPAVDVAGANALDSAAGFIEVPQPATRFATVTQGGKVLPQLRIYEVAADASAIGQAPVLVSWCSLTGVLPTRLALPPGTTLGAAATAAPHTAIYVADGAGDGAVRVFIDKMAAPAAGGPVPACPQDRIPFGDPAAVPYKPVPLQSIALSPRWLAKGATPDAADAAGEILAGVTNDGAVLFAHVAGPQADTATNPPRATFANLLPAPPASYDSTGGEAMEPLQPTALARDVTFIPPAPTVVAGSTPTLACSVGPCTTLSMNPVASVVGAETKQFQLLAAVSTSDGSTWFIDTINRRFVDTNYVDQSDAANNSGYSAACADPSLPAFQSCVQGRNLSPPHLSEAAHIALTQPSAAALPTVAFGDGFRPGILRSNRWRVFWHGAIPGLDRREGILSTASGLVLNLGPLDLTPWTSSPEIVLAPGDTVGLKSATSPVPACATALADPTQFVNLELPITSISGGSLALGASAAAPFPPAACAGLSLEVAVEVRAAGAAPWMVFEGNTIRGRTASQQLFSAFGSGDPRGHRYDYPFDASPSLPAVGLSGGPPTHANDLALSFTISGDLDATKPGLAGSVLTWVTDARRAPVLMRDILGIPGGGPLLPYRYPSGPWVLLYHSNTGGNELVQGDLHNLALSTATFSYR